MKIHECVQGTEEWLAIRRGRPTASEFSKIITPVEGKLSKSSIKYMYSLLAQCFITDVRTEFMGTKWTDRGTDLEPCARAAFEDHTGLTVAQVGFVTDETEMIGCSPDGLIIDPVTLEYTPAGLEMKNLAPENHVALMHAGEMPADHKPQLHGSMAVTGLTEWHFWSFCGAQDPDYPDDPRKYKMAMRPFHQVIRWDDYTDKVSAALRQFYHEYAALRAELLPKLRIA
jgi:hypothetical protein